MKSSNDAGQSLMYPLSLHPPSDFSWPLFLTLFPKIILQRCQPLAATATYTRDSLQCAQPHTNSDSKLVFVLVTRWSTTPQPLLICCLYVRFLVLALPGGVLYLILCFFVGSCSDSAFFRFLC
ncbi:unnamed protein product [Prunus armeniaca]